MDILYLTYALNGLLPILAAIGLGVFLTRKYEQYWTFWWIGLAVFLVSQIILAPFQNFAVRPLLDVVNNTASLSAMAVLLISALIVGLSTALITVLLRYGMFRWWAKTARSWVDGLLTGAGFGGAEAIVLALLVLYNFVNLAYVRNQDLSKFVAPENLQVAQSQLNAYWGMPWYSTFNDAIQLIFTIPVQILITLIILQTFTRKQWAWMLVAIGFQTFFEAARIIAQNLWSGYYVDLLIFLMAVLSIAMIIRMWKSYSVAETS